MGKKIRAIIGTSVATGVFIAVPATAQAAPVSQPSVAKSQQVAKSSVDVTAKGYKRCTKGYFCLFTGKNGKGVMSKFKKGTNDLRDFGMNNKASSIWNRTGKKVKVYRYVNYKGYMGYYPPGSKGNVEKGVNNAISSLKVPH